MNEENEILQRLGAIPCEWCKGFPVAHAEHWYTQRKGNFVRYYFVRYWCQNCVPMSGHYEFCPDPCDQLMKMKRR